MEDVKKDDYKLVLALCDTLLQASASVDGYVVGLKLQLSAQCQSVLVCKPVPGVRRHLVIWIEGMKCMGGIVTYAEGELVLSRTVNTINKQENPLGGELMLVPEKPTLLEIEVMGKAWAEELGRWEVRAPEGERTSWEIIRKRGAKVEEGFTIAASCSTKEEADSVCDGLAKISSHGAYLMSGPYARFVEGDSHAA